MSRGKRISLAMFAVALLFAISALQRPIDKLRPQFTAESIFRPETVSPGKTGETSPLFDMSLQFFGAAAMGMREAVASMLWVRTDELFHTGNYEAILPLVRLVTWLDPHQIDVYSTGAWHLDYNFTDKDQRSDRRYIPPAIALMEEGINNNREIYDLYFDLAWTHYLQKVKDPRAAALWMEKAVAKRGMDPNTGRTIPRPAFVDRMLAHTYEKAGMFDKAEKQWLKCLAGSETAAKENPKDATPWLDVDICKRNLGLMLLRLAWRYGDMGAYERGIKVLDSLGSPDPNQKRALEAAKKSFAEFKARGTAPHDTQPPVDAKFQVTWKKVAPKVLVLEGKLALVPAEDYKGLASEPYTLWYEQNQQQPEISRRKWQDGCRLRILLADYNYDYRNLQRLNRFDWDVDKNQTIMMDDVMARRGEFKIKIDMSQDPSMYPFTKDRYRLVVWFNPQEAPEFIQDRIGWKGEGLTDKNCLDTKTIPGCRMIRKEFILRKSDII